MNGFQPEFENFRFSAGVGLAWNSPIGPLKFSYAIPINDIPGDKIQKFQFQVGTVFWSGLQRERREALDTLVAAIAVRCCLPPARRYAADYKIGFVNTERLFREAAPAKRAQQKLEKEFAARDAELQKLSQAGPRPAGALDKDGATMGEAERRNKERDLAEPDRATCSACSASSART